MPPPSLSNPVQPPYDGTSKKRKRSFSQSKTHAPSRNSVTPTSEESSDDDENADDFSDSGSQTLQSLEDEQSPDLPSRINKAKKTRTESNKPTTSVSVSSDSFVSLGVVPQLVTALRCMSIARPTAVQAECIPPLLSGRDCIGNAKTGSGKTVAFAVPILQKLLKDPFGIFALVLTPTRELAFQISEQFAVLGAAASVRTAVIVGGMDMMAQSLELGSRPHVVIATPGRLVDHLRSSHGEWDLSRLRFLVLDEADRLLTPTFSSDLSYLFSVLPKERQTCLFTATMSPSVTAIAEAPPKPGKDRPFLHLMKESVETVSTLQQKYILVPSHVREPYLFHLLTNPPESTLSLIKTQPPPPKKSRGKKSSTTEPEIKQPPPTIIFCNRPKSAAYLTILLKSLGLRSAALHSRLTQRERLTSLGLFRSSLIPVLISTDVGARGLDIEDVAMVINWDLPQEPEEYTHRVGRTARAGKAGISISFVTEKDEERIVEIETRINTKLSEYTMPEASVLEHFNAVSTAKRLATMELHDSEFGKREEIHKKKAAARNQTTGEEASVSPL